MGGITRRLATQGCGSSPIRRGETCRRGSERGSCGVRSVGVVLCAAWLAWAAPSWAQLTDESQTPETAGEGIKRSLTEQIGSGRGSVLTPDTSIYLIKRDPARAIVRGRQVFQRKFTREQGLGPRVEAGEGDLRTDPAIGAGLADSCAACHGRPRGSAGFGGGDFSRPDGRDAPHLFGVGLREQLADEITRDLRALRDQALLDAQFALVDVEVRLVSKGIDFGRLTVRPDGSVDARRVEGVDEDLRVRPFGAEGRWAWLREAIVDSLAIQMGLEAFDPDLCDATFPLGPVRVVSPSGVTFDPIEDEILRPPACANFVDPDDDTVVNEIPPPLVDYLEFHLLNSFAPGRSRQTNRVESGFRTMERIGCTDCHVRDLRITDDRRAVDVGVEYSAEKGSFNQLFARVTDLTERVDDETSPPLRLPERKRFRVRDVFSDFKRHDLGSAFHERNFDGTLQKEFMTPPLWGVGSTAPYGHDGRSIDLEQVILRHGGEARDSRRQFQKLSGDKRRMVIEALSSLVLYPPDDTASNLDRADPEAKGYPQTGHGSIDLSPWFRTSGRGE